MWIYKKHNKYRIEKSLWCYWMLLNVSFINFSFGCSKHTLKKDAFDSESKNKNVLNTSLLGNNTGKGLLIYGDEGGNKNNLIPLDGSYNHDRYNADAVACSNEQGDVGGDLDKGDVGGDLDKGDVGGDLDKGDVGGDLDKGDVGGDLDKGDVGGNDSRPLNLDTASHNDGQGELRIKSLHKQIDRHDKLRKVIKDRLNEKELKGRKQEWKCHECEEKVKFFRKRGKEISNMSDISLTKYYDNNQKFRELVKGMANFYKEEIEFLTNFHGSFSKKNKAKNEN